MVLLQVEAVNGEDPEDSRNRVHFPALTPLYPDRHIKLETDPAKLSTRIMDLSCTCRFWSTWTHCRTAKSRENIAFKRDCKLDYNESS